MRTSDTHRRQMSGQAIHMIYRVWHTLVEKDKNVITRSYRSEREMRYRRERACDTIECVLFELAFGQLFGSSLEFETNILDHFLRLESVGSGVRNGVRRHQLHHQICDHNNIGNLHRCQRLRHLFEGDRWPRIQHRQDNRSVFYGLKSYAFGAGLLGRAHGERVSVLYRAHLHCRDLRLHCLGVDSLFPQRRLDKRLVWHHSNSFFPLEKGKDCDVQNYLVYAMLLTVMAVLICCVWTFIQSIKWWPHQIGSKLLWFGIGLWIRISWAII